MIGADLRSMDDQYRTAPGDPRLIALNQDAECRPPYLVRQDNGWTAMIRHLAGNEFAIGVFNFCGDARTAEITFAELGVPAASGVRLSLCDIITGEELGEKKDDLFVDVAGHSCKLFRAKFVREKDAGADNGGRLLHRLRRRHDRR